jgi:hypothetical protein
MSGAEVATQKKIDLDTRGFGWLIDPAPARAQVQVAQAPREFSYFTYTIQVGNNRRLDTIWTCLPVDGTWAYMNASTGPWYGPGLQEVQEDSTWMPAFKMWDDCDSM